MENGPADVDSLPHPGRELRDAIVGAAGYPDRVEELLDPAIRRVRFESVQRSRKGEVLARGEVPVEQRLVPEVAHPAT